MLSNNITNNSSRSAFANNIVITSMTFLNYLIFAAFNLEKKKSPGLGPRLRALQSQARALSPLKPSSKAGLFWAGSGWAGSGLGAQARPGTSLGTL
ncbi:hypothetical protein GGU11DRAFT_812705 [Lentinula aff. detonsa]|nr:hypothetical protein GGU11DRAFT_812705 [Lentinula aff. detonsa]